MSLALNLCAEPVESAQQICNFGSKFRAKIAKLLPNTRFTGPTSVVNTAPRRGSRILSPYRVCAASAAPPRTRETGLHNRRVDMFDRFVRHSVSVFDLTCLLTPHSDLIAAPAANLRIGSKFRLKIAKFLPNAPLHGSQLRHQHRASARFLSSHSSVPSYLVSRVLSLRIPPRWSPAYHSIEVLTCI